MEHSAFIPLITLLPFILMLLSIALFPLFFHRFWDKNINKLYISFLLSIPVIYFLITVNLTSELYHTLIFDYVPFIILLGSLFVITGGIFIDGDLEATPKTNTIFLALGAVLSSILGTTGAAMLLIRPLIQTNKERKLKTHTILFYIGIVANTGGLLTPIGDPPLFMMYLRGVPFFWFIKLFPEWFLTNLLLLLTYYFVDSYFHKKESLEDLQRDRIYTKKIKIKGKMNFLFILGVILAVAFVNEHYFPIMSQYVILKFLRDVIIIIMAIASLFFTPHLTRMENSFTWEPIKEVAYLFLGIFITMIPCILFLKSHAATLGVNTPTQFYFYSGALSSFLDNTPTAVTFYSLALGLAQSSPQLLGNVPFVANIPEHLLTAICIGSVFFGSMTYIGNGPNFMVKSIAEENNIKMPDFFKYIYGFSLIALLPIFILINLIFI